ncbi:TPA: hypothetical protein ACH9Q4_005043, partial [Escherichia coli]
QVAPAQSEPDYYIGLRACPVVEAIVCGLPVWAQIFLMPDRCKQHFYRCNFKLFGITLTAHGHFSLIHF